MPRSLAVFFCRQTDRFEADHLLAFTIDLAFTLAAAQIPEKSARVSLALLLDAGTVYFPPGSRHVR